MNRPFKESFFESGFTLVELMVVVAIIGLLSAVAIPNFQKYQARSKTTEAKIQLAAIYTAEESFFHDYNMYHTCLRYMGYDPVAETSARVYTVGFAHTAVSIDTTAYSTAVNLGINTSDCPQAATTGNNTTYFLAGKSLGDRISDNTHITGTSNGSQSGNATMTFLAGAAGIVHKDFTSSSGTNGSSFFTIDQTKKISTVRTGY